VLRVFVASAACDTWFGEVVDIESIFRTWLATFDPEVEPLLVPSGVGINLHE